MATYTHFGKQADVFKHLIFCEVLQNEKPSVYVETNSASAIYQMEHTPEQQYGIYHFLENADREEALKNSTYYKLESPEMAKGNYLGSPALAMNILGEQTRQYQFFDIEKEALENVSRYADRMELNTAVQTCNSDSLTGVMELLPSLPASSFVHIDPYEIDRKGTSGTTYLDILVKATQAGMRCLLWYGFMTGDDKTHLNQYIADKLKEAGIHEYTCVELTMNSIRKDTIICNPGIVGSGILATNLSQKSNTLILEYSKRLVNLYQHAEYKSYDGSLYREVLRKFRTG